MRNGGGPGNKILGLYAGGMTVSDIAGHFSELYGVDTSSRVTDAVLEDVAAWRTRPLDAVFALMRADAKWQTQPYPTAPGPALKTPTLSSWAPARS